MKKIFILTTIVLIAGLSTNLNAQDMVTGGIDTVTVGSKMPYAVDASITPDALMNASQFDWFVTDNTDAVTTTGFTVDETKDGGTGYYTSDSVNINWTAAAGTQFKVKVAEVSMPKFGTGCAGSTEELAVEVVALPSIDFQNASGGGCALTTFDIPLNLTGYGPWTVEFTVEKNSSGSPATHTSKKGSLSTKGTVTTLNLTLDNTHLSGTGLYEVVITKIFDRISTKSLTELNGTLPGTNLFTLGINPTPVTEPIRHLENVY